MFDLDNWHEIWTTITRNKFRSILTGFGVFWGILMLIILFGLGDSLEGGFKSQFGGFASNSCFFNSSRTSEPYKGYKKGRGWRMNNKDLDFIREKAESVDLISPMLFGSQNSKNVVRGQKTGSYGVRGCYPEHFKIEQQNILSGRLINEIDIRQNRKVCVIGKTVAETLFDINEDPIGKYIRINGIYFQVVGVISPVSKVSIGGNVEESAFLPFTTMQQAFNYHDRIHFLACTSKEGYPVAIVEQEVKSILKAAHDISPTDEKAVWSINLQKEFEMFDALLMGVSIIIWFVGGMALLSGIIGISNIMLVTVKERTREIGVRRALGAKPVTIVIQIISESFLLTLLAGIGGLLIGVGLIEVAYQAMLADISDDTFFKPPIVPFWSSIKALGVLILAGIVAGMMPAIRALKVKAIDAIRDE